MKHSLAQRQELRMTPQLQQAIQLLQLSRLELLGVVATELVENPFLEDEDEGSVRESSDVERPDLELRELKGEGDVPTPTEDPRKSEDPRNEGGEDDWSHSMDGFSIQYPGGGRVNYEGEQTERELPVPRENLSDFLLSQLGVFECSDDEREAAVQIIGNLDENGYLRDLTLEELSATERIPLELLEDGLHIVQELEPYGVGARDLAECLLIQARVHYPDDEVLHQVIAECLPILERKDYSAIARQLKVPRTEVAEAHRLIKTLDPRPGSRFSSTEPTYIIPDVSVVKREGEWIVILNNDGLPRLRMAEVYSSTLRSAAEGEDRTYVQEKIRSARWLIKSIEQRQSTILKVTRSIVRLQQDFFDHGVDHLRPLVLREVADDIEMHESTVSRVTTNKYVQTPFGVLELKYFFNSSIRTDSGDDIAAEAVKQRIRKLIDAEDPRRPYSDQRLADTLLQDHGIDIARRTVAKYREALGILSSSRRKQPI